MRVTKRQALKRQDRDQYESSPDLSSSIFFSPEVHDLVPASHTIFSSQALTSLEAASSSFSPSDIPASHVVVRTAARVQAIYQTTIQRAVTLSGHGVHSNHPVSLTIHPADADHGVIFLRTGLANGGEQIIEATHDRVSATALCTVLGCQNSASVATIEHLMAALMGLGIDNALIEIDGSEMPILDGSSELFVDAFDDAGVSILAAPRRFIKVLKPVRVAHDGAYVELKPYDYGFRLDVEINFDTPVVGRQRLIADMTPDYFRREIARARTFGFMRDVERLWKAGYALGASLDNTVAIGEKAIVNPEGLRYPDEFVRHKMLDAVGDLALAGASIIGEYRGYCAGHSLNNAILEALFSDESNYEIVHQSVRRDYGASERPAMAAAYAPDRS
jgi:UDP-3-O-[3-hydroxymyristoyl] N-acetylglucosamine deacetylase